MNDKNVPVDPVLPDQDTRAPETPALIILKVALFVLVPFALMYGIKHLLG